MQISLKFTLHSTYSNDSVGTLAPAIYGQHGHVLSRFQRFADTNQHADPSVVDS